ncbi:MAG: hypothetical protein ACK41T_06750 [Pseudobdellovibrio sp.]
MKKVIIAAIIAASHFAYALPAAKETKPVMSTAEARSLISSKKELREFHEGIKDSSKMTPAKKEAFSKYLTTATSKVNGVDNTSIMALVSKRPETMETVVKLAETALNGTPEQAAKAKGDLVLFAKASKYSMSKTEADGLIKVTEMTEYNQSAKDFKKRLTKTLEDGAESITKSFEIASDGKITLKKILDCTI